MNFPKPTAVLLAAFLCLPALARSAPDPSPSQQLPRAMQAQVNADLEVANPTSSPDGLTFTSTLGYDGPQRKPSSPGQAHHVWMPSIVVNADEKLISCATGATLALAGSAIDKPYSIVALEADHRQVATDGVCIYTGDYLFYWKATEPGAHTLRVVFTPDDGSGTIAARSVRVVVSNNAPCSLAPVASPIGADAQVPIVRTVVSGFKPIRSMVIVNDGGFDLTDTQNTLAFPASKLPVGGYALSTASFAADGTRFVSSPQLVSVQRGQ